jgi:hypothetical protein
LFCSPPKPRRGFILFDWFKDISFIVFYFNFFPNSP